MLAQRLVNTECKGCKERREGRKGEPCNRKKCIPRAVREIFHKAETPETADENFWREIAARAVLDACGFVESAEERDEAVKEGRKWFLDKNDADREEVFALAGLDASGITMAIVDHIAKTQ